MILKKTDKSTRPVIRLVLSPADWSIELVSILLIAWIFGEVIYRYPALPSVIPSHFNLKGEIDNYGNKNFLWFLPALSVVLYVVLTFINRIPHTFNYLVTITAQNAPKQYLLATRMIRIMKLLIIAMLLYISHKIIHTAIQPQGGPQLWLLPIFLGSLMVNILIYLILSSKK